jgi:hypothetical protein
VTSAPRGSLRRATFVVTASLTASIGLAACGSAANQAGTTTTTKARPASPAAKLLSRAMSNARAAGSAHIDAVVHQGQKTGEFVSDSATSSGSEVVTVGSGRTTLEVVHNTGYVQANADGLTQYLNFPKSYVSRLQNRWIEVKSTETGYSNVFGNVTLPGALALLTPSRPITETGTSTVNGQQVMGLRGSIRGGTATVFVSTVGTSLPVEVVATAKQASDTATLDHWGEPVHVVPPHNPIPLSSLH